MPPIKNPPQPTVVETPNSKATDRKQSWQKWVEKNAKPKSVKIHFHKPEPTRFQKPGPMTMNDWMRFHKWLGKTMPKKKKPPKPAAEPARPKFSRPTQSQVKEQQQHARRITNLAKPKHKRSKHEPPRPKPFPHIPQIDPKRPPKPEKYRPFEPIILPVWWYHDELEAKFWREMRFPISNLALKYQPTKHTCALAQPREPPRPHCPLPPKIPEIIPKRVKMTGRQWRRHLLRLEYLSHPKYYNSFDEHRI